MNSGENSPKPEKRIEALQCTETSQAAMRAHSLVISQDFLDSWPNEGLPGEGARDHSGDDKYGTKYPTH